MKKFKRNALAVAGLLMVAVTAGAGGPDGLELSWYTIDGGGAMRSSGSGFELSGTIGQPDAGQMGGGGFTLTGGFWFGVVTSDCNDDGVVNVIDYGTFEECLSGPGEGLPKGCSCYDLDDDGDITMEDFAAMQAMFNG